MKIELWNKYDHIKGISFVVTEDHRLNISKRTGRRWECTLYLKGWFWTLMLDWPPAVETGRIPF